MSKSEMEYKLGAVYFDKEDDTLFVVTDNCQDSQGDIGILKFDGDNGFVHHQLGDSVQKVSDNLEQFIQLEKIKMIEEVSQILGKQFKSIFPND